MYAKVGRAPVAWTQRTAAIRESSNHCARFGRGQRASYGWRSRTRRKSSQEVQAYVCMYVCLCTFACICVCKETVYVFKYAWKALFKYLYYEVFFMYVCVYVSQLTRRDIQYLYVL